MSYTKGPWLIDRNHDGKLMGVYAESQRRHDLDFICLIDQTSQGDFEANAKLIAAAPELLKACQRAFHVFENDTPRKCELLEQIRMVIVKAVGDI